MKKFEGWLFCTDLDGTLYDDNKAVSKENMDAIAYFKSEGGLFTFITGRVPLTAVDVYETVRPNAPYGCINGGGIYDGRTNTYVWDTFVPNAAIELVRAVDAQLPEIGIQLNTEKQVFFNKDNETMVVFREVTGLPNVQCHYQDVKDPVLKVVFGCNYEQDMQALIRLLNEHPLADQVDFIRSEKHLYEILPKGVSKGSLLMKMAELLDIDPRKTIAVGDYNNDISMIKAAGHGFAVANAVSEVKAVAKHITVSNNEHAIRAIVDGLDAGKWN